VTAAVIERLRAGDVDALELVVREHAAALRSTARRILRDDAAADDAVQDAFVSALRSLDRFRGESRLHTWLHRIVVNAALAALRRRRPWDLDRADEQVAAWLPQFVPDGHRVLEGVTWVESVEELLARAETRARVRASIDAMPEPHRSILLLRDIEELDTREVAELLELQPGAVKVRLHRARQALLAMLQAESTEARHETR
jgi:RNA polymerase sigma-70 factor, ECF subfamily